MNKKYYIKVEHNGKIIEKRLYDDYKEAVGRLSQLALVAKQGLLEFSDIEFETIEDTR